MLKNILGQNFSKRFAYENIKLSSQYEKKKNNLKNQIQKIALKYLEHKTIEYIKKVDFDNNQNKYKSYNIFENSVGIISYSYSLKDKKFIFNYFIFHENDGDGKSSTILKKPSNDNTELSTQSIAAFLSVRAYFIVNYFQKLSLILKEKKQNTYLPLEINSTWDYVDFDVKDICKQEQINLLPYKSILSNRIHVKEQLDNIFANQIMIGEFICSASSQIFHKKNKLMKLYLNSNSCHINFSNKFDYHNKQNLHSETIEIIESIFKETNNPLSNQHEFYNSKNKAYNILIEDDRNLQLIKIAMIYNLSQSVTIDRKKYEKNICKYSKYEKQAVQDKLIRKYSLLIRFSFLINQYLFADSINENSNNKIYPMKLDSSLPEALADKFIHFDKLVIDACQNTHTGKQEKTTYSDTKNYRKKIISILSELLEIDKTDTPIKSIFHIEK